MKDDDEECMVSHPFHGEAVKWMGSPAQTNCRNFLVTLFKADHCDVVFPSGPPFPIPKILGLIHFR